MKQVLWYNRKCYKKARWQRKIYRLFMNSIKTTSPEYTEEERLKAYDDFITGLRSRTGTSGYYCTRYY